MHQFRMHDVVWKTMRLNYWGKLTKFGSWKGKQGKQGKRGFMTGVVDKYDLRTKSKPILIKTQKHPES